MLLDLDLLLQWLGKLLSQLDLRLEYTDLELSEGGAGIGKDTERDDGGEAAGSTEKAAAGSSGSSIGSR